MHLAAAAGIVGLLMDRVTDILDCRIFWSLSLFRYRSVRSLRDVRDVRNDNSLKAANCCIYTLRAQFTVACGQVRLQCRLGPLNGLPREQYYL